ncbi:MAG TPA: porin, partial [Bradyrhizobium sp.]|nr:porin [Bradyrhizobium sp.]
NIYDGLVGGSGTVTGVNQFTYTAEFGQGVSASISVQDPVAYTQAGNYNLVSGAFGTSDIAGTNIPDIIGNVQVDQAWGLFKASLVAHDNHAGYYGASELTGHPDDRFGWAGQLALSIKNIPTGPGDVINIQGVYTDGATRYNIQNLASSAGAATIYGSSNLVGAYESVGFGMAPDSVFAPGGSQHLIQTWGGRGAFNHNWDPYWSSAIYGAFAAVHYDGASKSLICGSGGGIGTFQLTYGLGVTSCNPDFNIAQLGTITRWTPVKNLTFSGEFVYTHLDQNMSGVAALPATASIGKPATLYQLKDQDTYQVLLRAQRNW